MRTVPELSLTGYLSQDDGERIKFIDSLFSGLKEFGFIVLKDHPVDLDLLDKAYQLSVDLFNLSESDKMKYCMPEGGQRGYTPFGKEHAKNSSAPDLKEFWHVGRDLPKGHRLEAEFDKNLWPSEFSEFQKVFQTLFKSLDDTGRILLEALTYPLQLPKDYFANMTEAGTSILRLLHYPPLAPDTPPSCVRAAAHEDINLITLLVSASASGLELLTREGRWLPIETAKNNIIVDAGDMLARITNDIIPATTHRVVNPKGPNVSRYSMPFFMHPNPDAWLTCVPSCSGNKPKYPDILAGEFLNERLREIGLVSSAKSVSSVKASTQPLAT